MAGIPIPAVVPAAFTTVAFKTALLHGITPTIVLGITANVVTGELATPDKLPTAVEVITAPTKT